MQERRVERVGVLHAELPVDGGAAQGQRRVGSDGLDGDVGVVDVEEEEPTENSDNVKEIYQYARVLKQIQSEAVFIQIAVQICNFHGSKPFLRVSILVKEEKLFMILQKYYQTMVIFLCLEQIQIKN